MFDVSLGELLLISVVALVVLGPERLPTVARALGTVLARVQRFVASIKNDIRHQTHLDHFYQLRQDLHETARTFHARLQSEVDALHPAEHTVPVPMPEEVSGGHTPRQSALEDSLPEDEYADVPYNNEKQLDLFDELTTLSSRAPQVAHPTEASSRDG